MVIQRTVIVLVAALGAWSTGPAVAQSNKFKARLTPVPVEAATVAAVTGSGSATAVLTGTITRYEPDIAVGFSADPARARTARRRLQLSINVDFVDKTTGKSLYKRDGLSADGEYDERDELAGRRQAIQRIISDIIEGAQSQW